MERITSMSTASTSEFPVVNPPSTHAAPPPLPAVRPATSPVNRFQTLGLVVVFITQLMFVVDASIVNVALPDIQKELHFSASALSWVITAYALAFAGLMLLSGKIGSIIGARRALIIGTIVFIVASVAGGFAPTAEVLVIARVVQGIGAAIAAPSTLVLLIANTRVGAHRARALSFFVLAAGSGGAIGVILGGVLTTNFGWQWVMFINAPIGVAIVVGAILFLKETARERARLDVGGAAASTIGMVALVFAFTSAASDGWGSPVVLISFAVAVIALVALVFIERNHISPVVPLQLLRQRRTVVPLVAMLLVPAGLFAFFYFIALFTQQVLGFDPLGTGLALLPFVLPLLITSQLAPRLLPRFGEWLVTAVGLGLLVVGLLWLSQLTDTSTFVNGILGPLVIMGLGAGLTFGPITGLVMHHAPDEHTSAASSVLQAMQQLGGSVGVAALTSVFVATTAVQGEARGISISILGGAAFILVAFLLFSIWGSRIPAGADSSGESTAVAH